MVAYLKARIPADNIIPAIEMAGYHCYAPLGYFRYATLHLAEQIHSLCNLDCNQRRT